MNHLLLILLLINIFILLFYIIKNKSQSLRMKRCINFLNKHEIVVDKFDVFNVWDAYDKKIVKAIAILKEGNRNE